MWRGESKRLLAESREPEGACEDARQAGRAEPSLWTGTNPLRTKLVANGEMDVGIVLTRPIKPRHIAAQSRLATAIVLSRDLGLESSGLAYLNDRLHAVSEQC